MSEGEYILIILGTQGCTNPLFVKDSQSKESWIKDRGVQTGCTKNQLKKITILYCELCKCTIAETKTKTIEKMGRGDRSPAVANTKTQTAIYT